MVQVEGGDFTKFLLVWVTEQALNGACLFLFEGLPGAGKTRALDGVCAPTWSALRLDDFIARPADENVPWLSHVLAGGAREQVAGAIESGGLVAVDGAAAWLLVEPLLTALPPEAVRRIYFRVVVRLGEQLIWTEICDIEAVPDDRAYRRSIEEHHLKDRPWLQADLILSRIQPNENL